MYSRLLVTVNTSTGEGGQMLSRNSATDGNFITTGHFSAVVSFIRVGQRKSAVLIYIFPY